MKRYDRFADFYPVYLAMHSHPTNRRLHLMALLAMPIFANAFAWVGHIFFQRNRPGVARYPVFGAIGNWVMTRDVLLGRLRW